MQRKLILIAALACAPLTAVAQMTLTFSAATITGDGEVVPELTWSTSPPAQSCAASGAPNWTGTKAAAGTETLAPITSSATYNLECTWPGDSIVTFTWTNPTENTDGSAYTDAKLVRIKYTFNPQLTTNPSVAGAGEFHVDVPQTPTPATMRTVTGITQTGTLRGAAYAQNMRDVFSAASNAATKVFTGLVTVNRSVGIVVNPVPSPITNFEAQ